MVIQNIKDGSEFVCNIKLTITETKAILQSLGTTMCSGDELTVSMKLEDKLYDVIRVCSQK